MRRIVPALVLLMVVFTAAAGCGRDTKVGTEELLDIEEQKQKERLGEILKSPTPTAAETQGAIGQASPGAAKTTEPPKAEKTVFEVTLTNDHPYYGPQENIQVAVGTVLRITNKDDNQRRYASTDGTYDTGPLAVGQTKEIVANVKGNFDIRDDFVPFATSSLQVY